MIRSSPSSCPRRAFDCGFLLHLLTAAFGTTRTSRHVRTMSAVEGSSDIEPTGSRGVLAGFRA
jgi:hypothetical protein